MATSASTARVHTRRMIEGSPAWKPQATFALVTTPSRASSSPSRHTPNPSPRSALRSTVRPGMVTAAVWHRGRGPRGLAAGTRRRVRLPDRLGLRRPAVAQVDREDGHGPDREELRLPVLEGAVPEVGLTE